MGKESVTALDLYRIGSQYFGGKLLVVEVWAEGLRFVWIDKGQPDDESAAFLHINLDMLSIEKIEGFLDTLTGDTGTYIP
ncbi:hypothetical protein L8P40_20815 [Enterobacter kobei]|uniref:hypothetical protein n=1 Tax=Enterobacter kobei TaxID=208224 RepID=UPI002004619B|nr:hypothetical protein [Enterobacter kobei]MCK7157756.1 hypothetical protein [Enterobacter kobei]MCK7243505.1 hypothetical protein [Enterobacter kobei]MCK7359495.1 hypothetical protein [Enterobacter roggenkampii]